MYNPPTTPILNIGLNNTERSYDNFNNIQRPIIKLIVNDVSDIDINKNVIRLSFTQDLSVNIIFERSFDFNFNQYLFLYADILNNEYINWNTADNSNTILFSTNFSGIDLNQTLDTSSLDTSANISFTVFNSNPIIEQSPVSVKVQTICAKALASSSPSITSRPPALKLIIARSLS